MARPRSARSLLTCLALAAVATACARPDRWVETYPDIATRARQDPQAFLGEVYRQWDDLHGLVGSYQVRVSRGLSSRTLHTQIYLLRDGLVTIEILGPGGGSEGYLTAGTREIGFWASDENRLYRGEREPGAFGRALGIDLEPRDIVAVLMGFGVARDGAAAPTATWDESQRRIRVGGSESSAWLHPVFGHFERVVISTASGPVQIVVEEWAEGDIPVPVRLTIRVVDEDTDEDVSLQLRLADAWQANPRGLDAAYFDVLTPAGALVTPLAILTMEGGLLRRGLER